MKKPSKAEKLKVMRSVVRDLSDARGGALGNPIPGACGAGATNGRSRGNDRTCKVNGSVAR